MHVHRQPANERPLSDPESPKTAIIIGGGFGGIAAALRLKAKGYAVRLIDRAPRLGGRAQVFERNGFRHDAGPTVITAPFLFVELFKLFDKTMADYVQLVEPKQWYRFYFDTDGTQFDYGPTQDATEAEIRRISPADVSGYRRFNAHVKKIFDIAFVELGAVPFHSLSRMIRYIPTLVKLRCYETVWQMISRFLKDDRLRKAFSIQPLLLGGNPHQTTSIYGLINHIEREYGVWFPMGGTGALVDGLTRLMQEEGISIQTDTTVRNICIEHGHAVGVCLEDGKTLPAHIVVSNIDPKYLYAHMLPPKNIKLTARVRTKHARNSMGLFVLYFGAHRQWPDVAHHTVWFGERHKDLLDDIFNKKILAEDFSLYLHRPTATDPSFAPSGCDSFYVLCPVPNLQGNVDWSANGPRLQKKIIAALDRTLLPGLNDAICDAFYMDPTHFREDYLSVDGTGFSIAPQFTQSAWFRYHNRAEGIENLYLVGAGTHPGAGVPGVVCSAKVLDELIPAVEVRP